MVFTMTGGGTAQGARTPGEDPTSAEVRPGAGGRTGGTDHRPPEVEFIKSVAMIAVVDLGPTIADIVTVRPVEGAPARPAISAKTTLEVLRETRLGLRN